MFLKDLFYLKWFSSRACAAPMNVDCKSKSASKHARSFIEAINLNETGFIALILLTEKIYERVCLRKRPDSRIFDIQKLLSQTKK